MPQMNPAQARVVDAVLSTAAQGYRNAAMVYQVLFPLVPVSQRGGKILTFGRESFRIYNTARSPGQNTRRIQLGHDGAPYVLEQHALEGMLPMEINEEATASLPGVDMGSATASTVQDIIELRTEQFAAGLATNLANYPATNKVTLGGTDKWTDPASKPTQDIQEAKAAVRAAIGRRPNTVVLSAKAFDAAQENPSIIDRIKYTGRDTVTTDLLAALWGVQRVAVGESIYEDASGVMQDCWGGDVVVAYTEVGSVAERGKPSYGYTYRLSNYPIVEQPYYDRSSKSWIYPVTDELMPVIAGASAGFLIKSAA
ncbi:major capsid protein [Zoogloea sp.]|uniref:major capsid protein n=1 Tax=Zoogloea sp. TaxID=49181 RepID=UPI001AD4D30D|nr:major capsid protein [Zoogloea sp.]MBN8283395.1 major capsid protein [Zoogloea sp.]